MSNKINRIGYRFNNLTVIEFLGSNEVSGRKRISWLCRCDCGKTIPVDSGKINYTESCGCKTGDLISKFKTTHGATKTAEYKSWSHMKSRCYNPKDAKYKNYGERGITVCDRWLKSFEQFLSDMGKKPTKNHSIDRIDNNGNYELKNCRWGTSIEQMNNTTRNKFITFNGETLTVSLWAVKLGWNKKLFDKYIRMGKPIEELAKRYIKAA